MIAEKKFFFWYNVESWLKFSDNCMFNIWMDISKKDPTLKFISPLNSNSTCCYTILNRLSIFSDILFTVAELYICWFMKLNRRLTLLCDSDSWSTKRGRSFATFRDIWVILPICFNPFFSIDMSVSKYCLIVGILGLSTTY